MKKTYEKPALSIIELGTEASIMMLATSKKQTDGWGTNTKSSITGEDTPWDATYWAPADDESDAEKKQR